MKYNSGCIWGLQNVCPTAKTDIIHISLVLNDSSYSDKPTYTINFCSDGHGQIFWCLCERPVSKYLFPGMLLIDGSNTFVTRLPCLGHCRLKRDLNLLLIVFLYPQGISESVKNTLHSFSFIYYRCSQLLFQ